MAILRVLAKNPRADVRAFSVDAAMRIGSGGPNGRSIEIDNLARSLVDDEDPDVRQIAVDHLATLRGATTDVLERLRRQALSQEEQESMNAVSALWRLVDLNDPYADSVAREVQSGRGVEFLRNHARAARYVANSDVDGMIGELREHSHDLTPALMAASVRLTDPRIREALRQLAIAHPTDPCLAEWQAAMESIDKRPS